MGNVYERKIMTLFKKKFDDFCSDITRVMNEFHDTYRSPLRFKAFGFCALHVYKAEHVELILKSRTNMTKGKPIYEFLHAWLGQGLLTRFVLKLKNMFICN